MKATTTLSQSDRKSRLVALIAEIVELVSAQDAPTPTTDSVFQPELLATFGKRSAVLVAGSRGLPLSRAGRSLVCKRADLEVYLATTAVRKTPRRAALATAQVSDLELLTRAGVRLRSAAR